MTNTFRISSTADTKRIMRRIRARVENCNLPECWVLNRPGRDKIWLRKGEVTGCPDKGKLMTISRLLYLFEYGEVPEGANIKTVCGTDYCQNPAHMRIEGYPVSYGHVTGQIGRHILTAEQAAEWFGDDE